MFYAFLAVLSFILLLPCFYLFTRAKKTALGLGFLLLSAVFSLYLFLGKPKLESLSPFEMRLKLETLKINLLKKEDSAKNLEALAFVYERLGDFENAAKTYAHHRALYGPNASLILKELDARLEAVSAFSKEDHETLLKAAKKLMPHNGDISFYEGLLSGKP